MTNWICAAVICVIGLASPVMAQNNDSPPLPDWIRKNHLTWNPPSEGVVPDSKTAIIIAHAVWVAAFPNNLKQIGSEQQWEESLIATLKDNVWEVTRKSDGKGVGGGIFFYISKKDGRVVGIFLTQ